MEDRTKYPGSVYAGILGRNPVLKKGLFNPDLMPICDKYEKGMAAYKDLVKRKEKLAELLGISGKAMQDHSKEVGGLATDRAKIDAQNNQLVVKFATELNGFMAQGAKADPIKVSDTFNRYASSFDSMVALDKAHSDKQNKALKYMADLNKTFCDNYKKEAAAIAAAITKLETDEDNLEAQIKKTVVSYQKVAVQIDNSNLESDLQKILGLF